MVQEISSTTGIVSLVAAKMGIAVLSQSLRNYIWKEVVSVDLYSSSINRTFISAVNDRNNENPCLKPLLEYLDEKMVSWYLPFEWISKSSD